MEYIVVEQFSGKIVGAVESNVLYIPPTEASMSSDTHYWDIAAQKFTEREFMGVTVAGTTISGVPCNGTFHVTGPLEYTGALNSPSVALVFDIPGVYTITLTPEESAVKWKETSVVIEVLDE